jgi:hypothetical protein
VKPARYFVVALLLIALAIIYGALVIKDPVLNRDDRRMIDALHEVRSVDDYVSAVKAGKILDVQPIRDLTLIADLKVGKRLRLHTFHLTNFILWICILFAVHQLLRRVVTTKAIALYCTAVFVVHPAFVNSVGWISARKHLLSCLFILLATLRVMHEAPREGKWRLTAVATGLYALSIFSQPINVLWPIWVLVYRWRSEGRSLAQSALEAMPFSPVLLVGLAVNYWYYTGPFVQQTGAEKFVTPPGSLGVALLAQGRYFANLVFPVKLATSYSPGSALNLVGLIVLPLFLFISAKVLSARQVTVWSVFYFLPLCVVTVRMTNIFVSDSYLLVPAVGLWAIIALVAERVAAQFSAKAIAGLALTLTIVLGVLAFRQARSWESDEALWHHAYRVEPTPNAMAKEAYYLASEGRTTAAVEVALRLGETEPSHLEYGYVLARAVSLDATLSRPEKIQFLESHRVPQPWFHYYLASLLAPEGRWSAAWTEMQTALTHPQAFKSELAVVAAEAVFICRNSGIAECETITRPFTSLAIWDGALFQRRLAGLTSR